MLNKELILTLLNINKIGRRTVNKLIENPLPLSTDPWCILNFIMENISNYNLELGIQDIIIAKNKSLKIINYCEENNINIMTILDYDFPIKLKIIPNNPVIIFYKGNKFCILNNKSIAIIGTRKPTLESKKITSKFAQLFSNKDYIIISGLAYGVDYSAHNSTIKNHNKTLAVLPSGISNVYPSQHKSLCDDILYNNGCIISEYLPFEMPYKNNFIERDRLQSALALGVIVVECHNKSGTMHTVNFAKEQNKIIFCYKHNNMKLNCRSGNDKLLKDKSVYVLDNNYNIDLMYDLLECKLEEINSLNPHISYSNLQMSFEI